jgi:hypothetical protein
VKTCEEDVANFREECLYWQEQFGLKHWALQFFVKPCGEVADEAVTLYDCETREARITYYLGVEDCTHPCDVALHEMLHVLFADMLLAGITATSEDDAALGREEHKVIEVLLKVLPRKRRRS